MDKFVTITQEVDGQKVELIEFYDEHVYKIGDTYLPSISKKLGIIDKGPSFHKWERETGLQATAIGRIASDSGIKIHNAIEASLKGDDVQADDELFDFTMEEWKKYLAWADWWNYYEFVPMFIEQIVYDMEQGTAGKLDCIAYRDVIELDKDGEPILNEDETLLITRTVYVMDWKSGNYLYESHEQQIQFYKNAAVKLGLVKEDAVPALIHVGSKHSTYSQKAGLCAPKCGMALPNQEISNEKLTADIKAWDVHNASWKPPTLVYPRSVKIRNTIKKGGKN